MKKFLFVLALSLLCYAAPALADGTNSDILAGNEAAAREEYDVAITYYNKAINSKTLDPKQLAVAYNNRGCAYDDSGREDQAIADFNQAIKLDPKYDAPYFSRSFIYERRGDYAKAIADMEKAVSIDPGFDDFKVRLEWLREQKP